MSETNETDTITQTEKTAEVVGRVLNLSIFFVGIGIYAIAGLGLHQTGLLVDYQLTYFVVGIIVGIVGLLLALVTR